MTLTFKNTSWRADSAPTSTAGVSPDEFFGQESDTNITMRGYVPWGTGVRRQISIPCLTIPGQPNISIITNFFDGRSQARSDILGWTRVVTIDVPPALEVVLLQRIFADIPGGYMFNLILDLFVGATTIPYIHRDVPYQHPRYNQAFANSIRFKPDGAATGLPDGLGMSQYAEAAMDIGFTDPRYIVLTDAQMIATQASLGLPALIPREDFLLRYVRGWVDPRIRNQTIPSLQSLQWTPIAGVGPQALTPMANNQSVTLPEFLVTIEWLQIPVRALNWHSITTASHHCNGSPLGSAASPFFAGAFPSACLVFESMKHSQPYRMGDDNFAFNVEYKFLFKPFGANLWFNWQTGRYQPASRDGATFVAFDGARDAAGNSLAGQVCIPTAPGALVDLHTGSNLIAGGDPSNLFFPPSDFGALFRPVPPS